MGLSVFPAPASGPTLAEITSAITTNAAPASVTNSSIATQVANNAPSSNNWVHVATSAAFNYSTSSVTFSGLSGYKKYKIVFPYANISGGASALSLRINGEASGDSYPRTGWYVYSGLQSSRGVGDQYYIGALQSSGYIFHCEIIIENCTTNTYKTISSKFSSSNNYGDAYFHDGHCINTSPVTSFTIFNYNQSGTFGGGRNIYLFGAN